MSLTRKPFYNCLDLRAGSYAKVNFLYVYIRIINSLDCIVIGLYQLCIFLQLIPYGMKYILFALIFLPCLLSTMDT